MTKFANLVRQLSSSTGTGPIVFDGTVVGFGTFAGAFPPGVSFAYSIFNIDKPAETETGDGSLDGGGHLVRVPHGAATNFSAGRKSIAATVSAEWLTVVDNFLATYLDNLIPGPPGAPGAPGTNGNTILHGLIDPLSSVGQNGDFYLNIGGDPWMIFGPKAAGVWPAGVPLSGSGGGGGGGGGGGAQTLTFAPTIRFVDRAANPPTFDILLPEGSVVGDTIKARQADDFAGTVNVINRQIVVTQAMITAGAITGLGLPAYAGGSGDKFYDMRFERGVNWGPWSNKKLANNNVAPVFTTATDLSSPDWLPVSASLTTTNPVDRFEMVDDREDSLFFEVFNGTHLRGQANQVFDTLDPQDTNYDNVFNPKVRAVGLNDLITDKVFNFTISASDRTPAAFDLGLDINAALATHNYQSSTFTITAVDAGVPIPVTITGMQWYYKPAGGVFESTPRPAGTYTMYLGDSGKLDVTTDSSGTFHQTGTVNANGVSDSWTVAANATLTWYIVINSNGRDDTNSTSIGNLRMFATPTGPDLCTGGTPYSNGHSGGGSVWDAAKMFDNNVSTHFTSTTPTTGHPYGGYTFAVDTPTLDHITIQMDDGSDGLAQYNWGPVDFDIWKVVGATPVHVAHKTTGGWLTPSETRSFSVP